MTENELIEVLVNDLRAMAVAGADVPCLLRRVQTIVGKQNCPFESIKSFRMAFNAGIPSISAIGGWCGFGGELTDAQVDSFVSCIVDNYRASCPS